MRLARLPAVPYGELPDTGIQGAAQLVDAVSEQQAPLRGGRVSAELQTPVGAESAMMQARFHTHGVRSGPHANATLEGQQVGTGLRDLHQRPWRDVGANCELRCLKRIRHYPLTLTGSGNPRLTLRYPRGPPPIRVSQATGGRGTSGSRQGRCYGPPARTIEASSYRALGAPADQLGGNQGREIIGLMTDAQASPLLAMMREASGWDESVARLREIWETRGNEAVTTAASFARRYEGRRASMVFDVVASRQRKYEQRVLPLVQLFEATYGTVSLRQFSEGGPYRGLSLRAPEWDTALGVARALADFCDAHNVEDDAGVAAWAHATEPVRLAPRLDPYAGAVKGIRLALFAYLRMRSGADGLKPDGRLRARFRALGFPPSPGDDVGLVLLGEAAAEELAISRLVLDQLLWPAPGGRE